MILKHIGADIQGWGYEEDVNDHEEQRERSIMMTG
jgi:hypothetical protein